ncbi:MAG TPA: diguanylate cyclase, partial [Limnochordia bacterium]
IAVMFLLIISAGLVSWELARRVIAPLEELSRAAERIGDGDPEHPVPVLRRSDEIGRLSQSVEKMRRALVDHTRHLEQRVQERTAALRQMAMRDPLTALYNRHWFNEMLPQLVAAACRRGESIVFALIDVDDFKRVNDRYGHLIGDRVLQEMGRLIKQTLRQSDIAVRYGGDEFLAVFPQANLQTVQRAIERLRRRIDDWSRENEHLVPTGVRISVGLSQWTPTPGPDGTPDPTAETEQIRASLEQADKAMYADKLARRRASISRS